jgi:O-antigen/teichoic acid export membrane protein
VTEATATAGTLEPRGLVARVRALASQRLVQNFGWYMVGEVAVRLSRLITTIILARVLLPYDFGIAAIALTTFELIRVLANNGIGAMIVRATPETFAATCMAVTRISLAVALAMIALQITAGAVIAHVTARPDLFQMLAWLSLSYLAFPLTEVRYARIQRDNRLKALAGVMAAQVLLDNALTALLALAGYGAWAVVLPKLLTVPLYVVMIWRASPEPLPSGAAPLPLSAFAPFSLPLLGAEILAALRLNLDKVLVGALLGVEALGVYSFAFSAGLGISLALTAALTASLYPHLSEAQRTGASITDRFDAALKSMVLPVSLIIAVQAMAALIYVPIVFGERWAFAAPFVALICLSGLLRPLYDATCQLLRAQGQTRRELIGATAFTALLLGLFAVALLRDLPTALGVLAAASIGGHAAFALWARRRRYALRTSRAA